MDADATTALRKQGVASTDDKFKFIWFKVCERLTSVLQNKMSNYDTDVFMPIFDAIQKATGARPYSGKVGPDDVDNMDMAYRVVADHIRTLSFAIADGSCPGNEGREYVLRRILRRAVRYGSEVLKAQEGFFNGLVSIVVKVMGDVFPELRQHELRIREIIAEEEASFGKTLLKGIEKFKKAAQDVQGKILSGQDAFILWDTYGFPLDLTQLMVEERGLLVDTQGFNNAMDEARERSRSAQNKQAGGTIAMDADATAALRKQSKSLLVAVLVIVLSIYSFSFFLSFFPKDDQCNN
ncbi:alanine--tRNA ligase-like [Cucumis melo]|uniref:Alanine--tRNA ligase-like n=1 Tax=Cucumis melo TaxID=3656 RepID=A0ABM3L0S5_CUCME|nr:alanine--tRNA ligase-like [Cucumis melo]